MGDDSPRGSLEGALTPFRWDLMGFGLSHAWITGLLAQAAREPWAVGSVLNAQMFIYIAAIIAGGALIAGPLRRGLPGRRVFAVVAVLAALCTLCVGMAGPAACAPLLWVGFSGAGACGAFFEIVWAMRFVSIPYAAIPLYILFAMAISSLLNIGVGLLPSPAALGVGALLLMGSGICYAANYAWDDTPRGHERPRPNVRALVSVVSGCLVFSLTYNLFVTLTYHTFTPAVVSSVRFWANFLAALILVTSFMLVRRVSAIGIFRFILPVTAVGFVLFLIAPQSLGEAGLAVAGVGRKFFDILTLVVMVRAVQECALPPALWLGLLNIAKNAGYGIGLGLAAAVTVASNAQLVQVATILPVLILALIVCFVWLFPERTLEHLFVVQPARPSAPGPTLTDGVRQVADEHGLTPRELEVLELLARGRTEVVIMQKLGVSKGTAHTHVTHIYQKLGVHAQQELIEMVEKTIEDKSPVQSPD